MRKGKREKSNLANFGNEPSVSETQNNVRNNWINNGVKNEYNGNLKILLPLNATVFQMQASLPMKGLVPEQRLYRTNFICMGLLDLWGAQTENYKMKNSCPP